MCNMYYFCSTQNKRKPITAMTNAKTQASATPVLRSTEHSLFLARFNHINNKLVLLVNK